VCAEETVVSAEIKGATGVTPTVILLFGIP
jgi:hypothetical protein